MEETITHIIIIYTLHAKCSAFRITLTISVHVQARFVSGNEPQVVRRPLRDQPAWT